MDIKDHFFKATEHFGDSYAASDSQVCITLIIIMQYIYTAQISYKSNVQMLFKLQVCPSNLVNTI